jgi:glycosyltransferase involved in cell wall biosynthesis
VISVVVPCYNEQEVLPELYDRLTAAAEAWDDSFEALLVDDGSTDDTFRLASGFHERDARWKVIRFARNFGHQTAVSAGIRYAQGDCVIVIDADLQDPPEELHRFIAKWREGNEVVYGIRRKRKENVFKRACYKLFYRLLGRLAHINIPYDSGDFCLLDRKVVDLLNAMPERNRFVRGLRSWVGFRQTGLEYERHARAAGTVKYTSGKLLKLALDGIFSFSTVPLRMATYLGFIASVIALLGAVFTLLQRLFAGAFEQIGLGPVRGYATTVIAVLFLGGVQLICLGILGEYLGRIHDEVKRRPHWTIRETRGIEYAGPPGLANARQLGAPEN